MPSSGDVTTAEVDSTTATSKDPIMATPVQGSCRPLRPRAVHSTSELPFRAMVRHQPGDLSYGPPWAHYLGGYQDRLLGGPLGLPGLRYTTPEGVEHKDYIGVVLG
jgi:hypothetical protein